MTERDFDRWYRSAQAIANTGACVLLLPGEIDGVQGVVTWSWTPETFERWARSTDPGRRVAYLCKAARMVREKLEVEHGLELA